MTDTDSGTDWLRVNRENRDYRTRVHAASDVHELPGFLEGEGACTLRPFEPGEVGDVTGRTLLHLQCHTGLDTLSWARRGVRVTGLDFSPASVEQADWLAADLDLADRARFVVSDVYDALTALGGERFDIVYTGIGALMWLPDLSRWARVVSSLLAEGGMMYLTELHPLSEVLDDDGTSVVRDYFDAGGTVRHASRTHNDGPALTSTASVNWQHPLGEVVTALAGAGLRIDFLHEHDVAHFRRHSVLEGSDGEYRFPANHPRTPLLYSIRAVKSQLS